MGGRRDGATEQRRVFETGQGFVEAESCDDFAERRGRGSSVENGGEGGGSSVRLSVHRACADGTTELPGALSRRETGVLVAVANARERANAGGENAACSARRHHRAHEARRRRIRAAADERLHGGSRSHCEAVGGAGEAALDARRRFSSRPLSAGGLSLFEGRRGRIGEADRVAESFCEFRRRRQVCTCGKHPRKRISGNVAGGYYFGASLMPTGI